VLQPDVIASDHEVVHMRGVTVADIETALARPAVPVGPGKVGTIVIDGHCRGGILRVIITTDRRMVVSVMWREGGGRV
jgi:hypothetical protein